MSKKKQEVVIAYKGFDANMQCRGFQYKIGKTYTHKGDVKACESGFHACEYPLDVFNYYPPAGNVFAVVEQSGDLSRHDSDSKIASKKITVKASIDFAGMVKAAIEYTISRCDPAVGNANDKERGAASNSGTRGAASNSGYQGAASNSGTRGAASNSGYQGAASNSGYYGAASNSGYQGAASNSGNQGAASNSGTRGAASNSGYYGAASNSGYQGAASNSGKHGVAASFGYGSKAMSDKTGAIVCVYRNDDGELIHIRASKVGDNGIEPNTWYTLDVDGNFVEAA